MFRMCMHCIHKKKCTLKPAAVTKPLEKVLIFMRCYFRFYFTEIYNKKKWLSVNN
jgi:hypothetical protein